MTDIIASYWTIAGQRLPHDPDMVSPIPLEERVAAAARAGFTGMGFSFDDVAAFRQRLPDTEIRRLFADHGMRWIEIEALMDWFTDGERREKADIKRRAAFEQVAALGAFQIKAVGDMVGDAPLDRMAEEFARLCDEAAEYGARVTIELLPISNLASLERGRAVVGANGNPNGGLMFDIWHVTRGGIAIADIAALPPGICTGIELDDGMIEPEMPDLYEEMVHCRRLPGEGEFDNTGLIRAVHEAGFDGPYGIEVLSHAHRARTLEEAATMSYKSAKATIDAALSPVEVGAK